MYQTIQTTDLGLIQTNDLSLVGFKDLSGKEGVGGVRGGQSVVLVLCSNALCAARLRILRLEPHEKLSSSKHLLHARLENSHQVHEGQQAASVGGTTTADPGKTAEVHRLRQRLAHMQKYIWRMLRSIQARFCTAKLPRQTVDPQINGSKEPMLGMPVAMRCVRPLRMIWREAPC